LAGLFELVAGLAVLVGFQTRIASYLLAAFCLVTAFVFHSGPINIPDFPEAANGLLSVFNQIMMMKNITIAGAFLVLGSFGPGALSLDARLGRPVAA
ncbi:DoxX family protein, partial [Sinorhizobium fredii]